MDFFFYDLERMRIAMNGTELSKKHSTFFYGSHPFYGTYDFNK